MSFSSLKWQRCQQASIPLPQTFEREFRLLLGVISSWYVVFKTWTTVIHNQRSPNYSTFFPQKNLSNIGTRRAFPFPSDNHLHPHAIQIFKPSVNFLMDFLLRQVEDQRPQAIYAYSSRRGAWQPAGGHHIDKCSVVE